MPRYKMVVMSDPVDGREEEFNQWYQGVHLRELLALEGIKSAKRLRRARSIGERSSYSYVAIYEIETDDIDAVLDELLSVARAGGLEMSDAIDSENSYAAIYEDFGPLVHEDEP